MDLAGKTVLITGASSGIGLEASVVLARRGAQVVMVARQPDRAAAALRDVQERSGSPRVELLLCDLGSQQAVRALARDFLARHPRLDVLINNAGGVSPKRQLTVDGLEQTFATNHLAYFLLTNLLLDRLEKSAPARVVTVASTGHFQGRLDFADLMMEHGYHILRAYTRSKLCNVLFANELARRLKARGVRVTSNSLHPGGVASNIWTKAPGFAQPLLALAKLFMISPAQGAEPIVHLAASPELEGKSGEYWHRMKPRTPSRLAQDQDLARRLWEVSAKLVRLD